MASGREPRAAAVGSPAEKLSAHRHNVEAYISRHTGTQFSHGMCPGCMQAEIAPLLRELRR